MKPVRVDRYVRKYSTKAWACETVWCLGAGLRDLHSFPCLASCRSVLGWGYGLRTPVR